MLWSLAALTSAYIFYGLLVPSRYARAVLASVPADRVVDGFLCPTEVEDPDDADIANRVSGAVANDTLRRKKFAGRDDPMFHEPHWEHTSALLLGSLTIDRIEALPEAFRVGLFSRAATYEVVARSGVTMHRDLGFAVYRLAVKLDYAEPIPNAQAG